MQSRELRSTLENTALCAFATLNIYPAGAILSSPAGTHRDTKGYEQGDELLIACGLTNSPHDISRARKDDFNECEIRPHLDARRLST